MATLAVSEPATTPQTTVLLRTWWPLLPMLLIMAIGLVGPLFVPHDPERVVGDSSVAPNGEFWFGTDASGLDVFSRTIVATRVNLLIALAVAVLATLIGSAVGLVIGMNEARRGPLGWLARGGARVVDLAEAVPAVLLGLVVIALFGATPWTLTVALAFILSPIQIRLVRTEVLRVRKEAYLDAARIGGATEWALTLRHVLPNSVRPAWENASVVFAVSIIVTAALGFVGVGLPPPTPEWGSMLSAGAQDAVVGRWWAATFPALALASTVAAFAGGTAALLKRLR
ncbi:ABC transporter permease [Pseudonocardia sp. RS010]|uniref:ABC transporter permease n=1 Tax=Pseudonocardia sp. RS010 TaxID=3385979 RepID=UPI0039A0E388